MSYFECVYYLRFDYLFIIFQKIHFMRLTFEPQTSLSFKSIEETPVLIKSRDDIPALTISLLSVYTNNKCRDKILNIVNERVTRNKKATGRQGLNIWQVFVLAQFRLALNLDYDRLHYMVESNSVLRQLLGIESSVFNSERIEISYQRILDNVHLLDDSTLMKVNDVIVEFGHQQVFKKERTEALHLKSDSFVVETNVHFPTDYNLLLDAARKSLSTIRWFKNHGGLKSWRKLFNWTNTMKSLCLRLGRANGSGGKNKEERVKIATQNYLVKSKALSNKLSKSIRDINIVDDSYRVKLYELIYYKHMLDKHVDLLQRRVVKGEQIPQREKVYSIFEPHTEWINKGKLRPNVELGKKVCITTDQYGLIVNHKVMESQSDSQIVMELSDAILSKHKAYSWSFDKGFWHKDNKAYLDQKVDLVVMPKKGKRNKQQVQQEQEKEFKKYKRKHSAIESNINELENCGLDKCRDKGIVGFKRYVAIAITAYNLKRIGRELIKQQRILQKNELLAA